MDHFHYRDGRLFCEEVPVSQIAERVGTPFYLYSRATFEDHYDRFSAAFRDLKPLVCYSVKNCANIHLLELMVRRGAGIDVVSGGELFRALTAGANPSSIVFAGVGKSDEEIRQALTTGVGWLNVESEEEFENARRIAADLRREANVALRVNPNTYDPKTHQKTTTGKIESKFGVDIARARQFFDSYGSDPWLKLRGVHMHLGSPVYSAGPYVDGITKLLELVDELTASGQEVRMLDIGGGFLAHYDGLEETKSWNHYAEAIVPLLKPFVSRGGQIVIEPGRCISANGGVLISRVEYAKRSGSKKFVIIDTGMSHLIRPTLYEAYHFIWPTEVPPALVPPDRREQQQLPGLELVDVVGRICETGDFMARQRPLAPVRRGDLVCIFTAGAYAMAMASQYNATPRPPEVLVDKHTARLIRVRETFEDLVAPERTTEPIALRD